jgi:lipoprotein-releasing system permease protein
MRVMPRNVPLFIGLRYTRAKRRNQFISFISAFSLLGMTLGVMALIIVLSVMNGLDREMKSRILSVIPHGFIEQPQGIEDWQSLASDVNQQKDVLGVAPYIQSQVMVSFDGAMDGVELQGILPSEESKVSIIQDKMIVGSLDHLQAGEYGIVLGRILASRLMLTTGDKVVLTSSDINITPLGIFTRSRSFTLVGIFEAGAQIDANLALIHIEDAQKFLRKKHPQGLKIKTSDMFSSANTLVAVQQHLGGEYQIKDWSQTQGSLFSAVKMEKIVVTALLMIIVAVAAFNIVSSLVLMVADKRSDIAVLRTLGMSARQVMMIFIVQGTAVGFSGIILGAGLGSLIALGLSDIMSFIENILGWQFFDPDIFYIAQLPSVLLWQDLLLVCSVAFVLSFLATLYPAYSASQIQPAEALRYE